MIEQIRIRDLGVIADTTLELGSGFTAITGETGAGKTMVVTALGLLMGERSDAGSVRVGAAAARVGGLLHTDDAVVKQLTEDAGGEIEAGELTLTRTVSSEGRSRASIGGSAAPVGVLARIAERLFVVHGQNEQLRLKSAAAQREMLDRFGGSELLAVLAEYQLAHRRREALAETLEELVAQQAERTAEAARLRDELEAFEAVDPQAGEEHELAQRIERLGNLEELRVAATAALRVLVSDEVDPYATDAGSLIDLACRELERAAATDAGLGQLGEGLRSLSAQLNDMARELAAYVSDLDQEGPGELLAANERLAAINGLIRRYGFDTTEMIAYGAKAAARLVELEGDDERIASLGSELATAETMERELAGRLTALREQAAARLAELVTVELRALAMPEASFLVEVTPAPLGKHGADTIRLLLQAHATAAPRPLGKGASGGELSRIMLALEVVLAESDPVPTFVFDEVDAGVGGATAIEIGRRLARLAEHSQVIVVTHLAQLAAFAENHVQVVKDSAGGFTESSCRRLVGKDRLAEMARLLSGLADSESALAHAAELLELGRAA